MSYREANFDGLVGPTHNYAGLSIGNVASEQNIGAPSRPRDAALQGLRKARALAEMGLDQGILPPLERPDIGALRQLGFSGSDHEVLESAARTDPALVAVCSSASSMWTANAATVAPSADTPDQRVHFTPANLNAKFHRSLEPPQTAAVLRAVFPDVDRFAHHAPLPATPHFGDEGAANHTRLAASHGSPGLHLFVYGRSGFLNEYRTPKVYPARQTIEASHAVARLHGLTSDQTVFIQQSPEAIDAGVFHNDVISVGNENVLLVHDDAFLDADAALAEIRAKLGTDLIEVRVPRDRVSLEDAVVSYLFNSQLLTIAPGRMALVCPSECSELEPVGDWIASAIADTSNPIEDVIYFDLRQSMRNGGGPACLRLRVVLNETERAAVAPRCWMTNERFETLSDWVRRHYREELAPAELGDPHLLDEVRTALDELTTILGVGAIYRFQR